jgi:hypothetical protein
LGLCQGLFFVFNTLQNSINFAKTFIQYNPLQAGLGQEPAASIGSMIRNSLLNPPLTWFFNRAEITFSTVVGQQDYIISTCPDLSFVEKVSLSNDAGEIFEIKDIYNNGALAVSAFQQRPSAVSVSASPVITNVQNYKFRFLGVPDAIYTVTVVYQKLAVQFGPFFITSASNHSGANTTYTGSFDPLSFPVGATAIITGFVTNAANNGSFVVVSCSTTALVVANGVGVAETASAFVSNFSWDPIPNQYSDIYNNLFLSEALAIVDDARAQLYRQRGIAAFLSKATGLSEMQKNVFVQQWMARVNERQGDTGLINSGNTGRGI